MIFVVSFSLWFLPIEPASVVEAGSVLLNSQNIGLQPGAGSLFGGPLGGGDNTIIAGALLPDIGPAGTLADIIEAPAGDQISIYVVRPGDTLSQIAAMFGVSVNTIIWANDLPRDGKIVEGQVLVILPISGIRHTVVEGDTLESIVKKYKGDLPEVAKYNGFDQNDTLALGSVVIIPDGEASLPPAANQRVGGRPLVLDRVEASGYYLYPLARRGVKTQGIHGYNGVDLAAPAGTPVLAAASGRVIVSRNSGWNGGYGRYIVIEHKNGTQTLYSHNQENIVSFSQTIVQGQVIGYVGSSGRSTGSHLHFEVRGARNPF